MGEFVRVQIDQAIATIRLERPPMNAISSQLQTELAEAAAGVADDEQVRAVVLSAARKYSRPAPTSRRWPTPAIAPRRPEAGGCRMPFPRWPGSASRSWPRSPVTR